eukprot:820190_1
MAAPAKTPGKLSKVLEALKERAGFKLPDSTIQCVSTAMTASTWFEAFHEYATVEKRKDPRKQLSMTEIFNVFVQQQATIQDAIKKEILSTKELVGPVRELETAIAKKIKDLPSEERPDASLWDKAKRTVVLKARAKGIAFAHNLMEAVFSVPKEEHSLHWTEVLLFELTDCSLAEFSVENLDFLFQTQAMLDMPSSEDGLDAKRRARAMMIYAQFIPYEAPDSINISFKCRQTFLALKASDIPTRDWFADRDKLKAKFEYAMKQIRRLLSDTIGRCAAKDSFKKFLHNFATDINRDLGSKCFPSEQEEDEAHSSYYNNFDYRSLYDYNNDPHEDIHLVHSLPFYDHRHPLIGGEDNGVSESGSSLLIGGVVGASAVVIIMLIFCLGLAFGMIIYWGYSQKRALNVKRKKREMRNWIDDDEDRNEV